MAQSETPQHLNLKRLALQWGQQNGWFACALETRMPKSPYRADIAAYRPEKGNMVGITAIFECKQSRTDFLKDSYGASATLDRLKRLEERRLNLERLLKVHHPSLRNGDSLFPEYQSFDFGKLEHKTYRKVAAEVASLKNRLYSNTKFDKVARWKCANLLYLVVEDGILKPHEVPSGWGLLVRREGQLELSIKPTWQEVPEDLRVALLQRIAVAGTRRLNRELGVMLEERIPEGEDDKVKSSEASPPG